MAETSTEPRSETPPITMCDKPLHENHEPRLGDMSDAPAAASLDVETKAKSDSSSHEVPDNGSAIKFHDSSPNSSDSSSPNSSSPNSVHTTFPDSNVLKTSHLPDDSSKENQNTQPSTLCDTSSRSDSDGETVILGNPTAINENDSDKASPNNSSAEDSGAVSGAGIQINPDVERSGTPDSFSHDGSDSSSQGSTTTSPVSPRSISPASSTSTAFQVPLDTDEDDEDEPRIPQGSQSICAYASPVQNGCRTRTSCDRNDDTGRWHVEPDGFINEARRAGGPYLFPLPVDTNRLKINDPLHDILEDCTVVQPIMSILAEHGVHPLSMRLRNCEYKLFNRFNYLPTLIFSATRDTFDDSWVQACRQIWTHLSNVGLGKVNIEISEFEIKPTFVWSMQRTDRVWPVYMDLLLRIHDEVDVTGMVRLGIIREGNTDSRENLPLTVSMDVQYDSNRDWCGTRDHIVEILDDMNLPMVGVTIMKGKIFRG